MPNLSFTKQKDFIKVMHFKPRQASGQQYSQVLVKCGLTEM